MVASVTTLILGLGLVLGICEIYRVTRPIAQPIHEAAGRDDDETVVRLLAEGVDINTPDAVGRTPLLWALRRGRSVTAPMLIARGADVNVRPADGGTPLVAAVMRQRADLVEMLLDRGADPNFSGQEGVVVALCRAVSTGRTDVVRLLLERGADPGVADSFGRAPLHLAQGKRAAEMARLLIQHGAPVNAPDAESQYPLDRAASSGEDAASLLGVLVESGAKLSGVPRRDGRLTALREAQDAPADVLQWLVRSGMDVNASAPPPDGGSLLHAAVWNPDTRVLDVLVGAGADLELRDAEGNTPLADAAWMGLGAAVERLLALGADPHTRNNAGKTPADLARIQLSVSGPGLAPTREQLLDAIAKLEAAATRK